MISFKMVIGGLKRFGYHLTRHEATEDSRGKPASSLPFTGILIISDTDSIRNYPYFTGLIHAAAFSQNW
jgi:hypothetical protein